MSLKKKPFSHGFKIVKIIFCPFYYEECEDIHRVAFAQDDDEDVHGSISRRNCCFRCYNK